MKPGADPEGAPFFQEGTGRQHKILQKFPEEPHTIVKNFVGR